MAYILAHTRLGFCVLDIIALLILIGIVAYIIVKNRKSAKLQKALEDRLEELSHGLTKQG